MAERAGESTAYIIVGSGAAGTAAALQLARMGIRPIMLDVGITPPEAGPRAEGNLYEWRQRNDSFDLHIGADFRGVSDVLTGETGIAKLNAPNAAFVVQDAAALSPLDAAGFDAIQSFALGGLGNAWGAGLYRFVDADLAGFPIRAADLDPYADALTREIGISGADDDLTPYFGDPAGLQPPLLPSHNAAAVLARYGRKRPGLNRRGVFLGRPRVAALSVPHDGRPPVDYSNTEFWQDQPYLYTPAITLKKLIAAGQLDYRPGILVHSWAETPDGVIVRGREVATGAAVEVTGRVLLLAAGAIGTSKIVLSSGPACEAGGDVETRLPLLENPAVQIPFVLPGSIGRALDVHCFGLTQLNLIWQAAAYGCTAQGSLLEITSPMRAEFFGRFPLSARANLALVKQMLPAMLIMQLFFPASIQPPAQLSLQPNGRLRITGHPNVIELRKLGGLLAAMRSLGLWTHPILIYKPVTGHAIHYAGTLAMAAAPGRYRVSSRWPAGRHGAGLRGRFRGLHPFAGEKHVVRHDGQRHARGRGSGADGFMTTVLITGAGGFIARHLAPTLKEAGMRVLGTSRRGPGLARLRPHLSCAAGRLIADPLRCRSRGRGRAYGALRGTGRIPGQRGRHDALAGGSRLCRRAEDGGRRRAADPAQQPLGRRSGPLRLWPRQVRAGAPLYRCGPGRLPVGDRRGRRGDVRPHGRVGAAVAGGAALGWGAAARLRPGHRFPVRRDPGRGDRGRQPPNAGGRSHRPRLELAAANVAHAGRADGRDRRRLWLAPPVLARPHPADLAPAAAL